MKEYSLATTNNVQKANELINMLKFRPKTEMVGLGLIYGEPGLGKSRFAFKHAVDEDCIYFRLESVMTAKSFAERLYEALCEFHNIPPVRLKRTTADIFDQVVNLLYDYPDTVIFIDEIDYAFRSRKLLGAIRDLADRTLATFILIGMASAKAQLLAADSHYFDRCNFFCEFKKLSRSDVSSILSESSDISYDKPVIDYLHKITAGNIRRLVKAVYSLESLATHQNISTITMKDIEG